MYTVKEAAARTNLTEYAVRFYTDEGLVPTLKRDKNNRRQFDESAIGWLTTVKCLRECGMSIVEIKAYCDLCLEGDDTISERYEIISKRKEIALEQIEEAKQRLEHIEHKLKYCCDIMGYDPAKAEAVTSAK